MALYLASSAAVAALAPGIGRDLAWVPDWPVSGYLIWIANVAIILSAIALVRADVPLRLQLALAFAGPGLYVLLLLGMGAYFKEASIAGNVLMLGLSFSWVSYSEFLGSVVAFVIALASHRTSVLSRSFQTLGWVVAAAWLYMHGFGLTADHWAGSRPYLDGLPFWIFGAATVIGWGLSPIWLVGAISLMLASFSRNQRPTLADTALFVLVAGLIGLYFLLAFLD
jgi:hypothetical protein